MGLKMVDKRFHEDLDRIKSKFVKPTSSLDMDDLIRYRVGKIKYTRGLTLILCKIAYELGLNFKQASVTFKPLIQGSLIKKKSGLKHLSIEKLIKTIKNKFPEFWSLKIFQPNQILENLVAHRAYSCYFPAETFAILTYGFEDAAKRDFCHALCEYLHSRNYFGRRKALHVLFGNNLDRMVFPQFELEILLNLLPRTDYIYYLETFYTGYGYILEPLLFAKAINEVILNLGTEEQKMRVNNWLMELRQLAEESQKLADFVRKELLSRLEVDYEDAIEMPGRQRDLHRTEEILIKPGHYRHIKKLIEDRGFELRSDFGVERLLCQIAYDLGWRFKSDVSKLFKIIEKSVVKDERGYRLLQIKNLLQTLRSNYPKYLDLPTFELQTILKDVEVSSKYRWDGLYELKNVACELLSNEENGTIAEKLLNYEDYKNRKEALFILFGENLDRAASSNVKIEKLFDLLPDIKYLKLLETWQSDCDWFPLEFATTLLQVIINLGSNEQKKQMKNWTMDFERAAEANDRLGEFEIENIKKIISESYSKSNIYRE